MAFLLDINRNSPFLPFNETNSKIIAQLKSNYRYFPFWFRFRVKLQRVLLLSLSEEHISKDSMLFYTISNPPSFFYSLPSLSLFLLSLLPLLLTRRSQTCSDSSTGTISSADDLSWNVWLFFVAQLLHGAGAAPLFTLGVTFIDENVSKKMSSVYLGTV